MTARSTLRTLLAAASVGALIVLAGPGIAVAAPAAPGLAAQDPNPPPNPAPDPNPAPNPDPAPNPNPDPAPNPNPNPAPNPNPNPDPAPNPDPSPNPGPVIPPLIPDPAPTANPAPTAAPAPAGPSAAELERKRLKEIAKAAERERKAQATLARNKARADAQFAAAATKAQASWISRGRPDRMILVHRSTIDTVSRGQVQKHTPVSGGDLTLSNLTPYVPADWLSIGDGTATLSATLVLSIGVTLDAGPGVKNLQLTGGATAPEASSIYTGGGRLTLNGVTVASADVNTGKPMPMGPGRPFVVVTSGGRFDATDSTLGDLGTPIERDGQPGVSFNPGSGGSLVRTALPRNSVGLRLDRSQNVKLDDVTASDSASNGIVLRGDAGTTFAGVKAVNNGGDGVVVAGETSPRPITGISASGNKTYGLLVTSQQKAEVTGIVTAKNGAGGLEINRSTAVTVRDITTTDEPIGLYTHGGSSRIVFDGAKITGGRQGVMVEKSTTDLKLTGSTISGAQLGVSIGAHGIVLQDVTIADSRTGVAVQRGAGGITATRLTLTGGKDGFVANPGTKDVVLTDLTTTGVANNAVRMLSPGAKITGGRISGSTTGIDVQEGATISGIAVNEVDTGIRARSASPIRAEQVDVAAVSVGADIAPGTTFVLASSRVHALQSIRGTALEEGLNDLSLPPLSVLGAIGVPLVLLAVFLELFNFVRQRFFGGGATRKRLPPAIPVPG